MNFEQAKQEYLRLKASYDNGEISPEQFERAVYNLRLVDGEGRAWHIGLTSGEWYRKEGAGWVQDEPPAGGAAVRADKTFFGAPAWLALAVGGGGVLTALGVFAISMYFLLNSGAFPSSRVITATPGPSLTQTVTSTGRARTPSVTATPMLTRLPGIVGEATEFPTAEEEASTATGMTVTPTPTGFAPPAAATQTPSRTPRSEGTQAAFRVWKSFSYTTFESSDALQGEWEMIPDSYPDNRYDFVGYRNRSGMQITYLDYLIDITSFDEESYTQQLDIELEETFAFPSDNDSAYIDFMCRHEDWDNTYSFAISRTDWDLYKYHNSEETLLEEGRTPDNFRGGDWGRLAVRCEGNRISAWLNGVLLTSVEDDDRATGTWAITLYMDEEFTETSLYLASHRVFRGTSELFGQVLDRFQTGDVLVTLDRGLRLEGDIHSLGLTIENRSDESLEFVRDQIYLLGTDGTRYPVATDPPQNQSALAFPFTLEQQMTSGSVYFRGLNADRIGAGLDLIVDLSDFGLGQARFELPAE